MHFMKTTMFAFAALGSSVLPAAADVLLDYRDEAFRSGSPYYSAPERNVVGAALQKAPGEVAKRFSEDFALLGDASGAFTEPGSHEQVYLVQEKAAVAIEPFPDTGAPLLVVLRDKEPVGFFSLPGDVQYQRLVAAGDADGDGRDEVFLEASFMNMGQTSVSLDIASLDKAGDARIVKTLRDVYSDGCENPVGARERKAATVSLDGGPRVESFGEPCP